MSLLDELRASTAPLRRRLDDAIPPARARGGGEATSFLESFDVALSRCWPWLDWQALERLGLPGAAERKSRYQSLRDDLAERGLAPCPLPERAGAGDAEAAGICYVLEDQLARAWAIHERANGQAPAVSSDRLQADLHHWLETVDASEEFARRACSAACQSLEVFLAVFAEP